MFNSTAEREVKKSNCEEETALFDTQRAVCRRILDENKGKYASYKHCYEHNLFKFFGHRIRGRELTTISQCYLYLIIFILLTYYLNLFELKFL